MFSTSGHDKNFHNQLSPILCRTSATRSTWWWRGRSTSRTRRPSWGLSRWCRPSRTPPTSSRAWQLGELKHTCHDKHRCHQKHFHRHDHHDLHQLAEGFPELCGEQSELRRHLDANRNWDRLCLYSQRHLSIRPGRLRIQYLVFSIQYSAFSFQYSVFQFSV